MVSKIPDGTGGAWPATPYSREELSTIPSVSVVKELGAEAPSPAASTWVIDKRPNTLSAKIITADCLASQGFLSMPFTMLAILDIQLPDAKNLNSKQA